MADKIYKLGFELFNDGKIWRVPTHQRDYAWTTEKIDELLIDLDAIKIKKINDERFPMEKHFTGLLVFLDQPQENGIEYYNIIDGQQRLSTIVLIAASAKDVIREILNTDSTIKDNDREFLIKIRGAFDKFIYKESPAGQTKKPKLQPSRQDEGLFKILILKEDTLDSKESLVRNTLGRQALRQNYFKAYNHIYGYIRENYSKHGREFFEELIIKLHSGLTFIPFVAVTDTDAFNLFETLNDRGLQLSAFDLIKNKVLSKADGDLEDFESDWNDVFGRKGILSSNKGQLFLRNFLMVRHGHITNNTVYDTCKDKHLTTYASTKQFLTELNEDAKHFRAVTVVQDQDELGNILRAYIKDEDLSELLFLLNKTHVRQWVSIGYCAYHLYMIKKLSQSDIKTILNLLLNICIRFKILNVRFNYIEKDFPELACTMKTLKIKMDKVCRNVSQTNATKHVIKSLRDVLDKSASDEELNTALTKAPQFEDNDLAFVILRFLLMSRLAHGLTFSVRQTMTLEHVLPEKHKKTWGNIKDADSRKYSLGNMLLVAANANSQLKNKPLKDKQRIYKKNRVIEFVKERNLSCKTATQDAWIKHIIKDRESRLLEQLKKALAY